MTSGSPGWGGMQPGVTGFKHKFSSLQLSLQNRCSVCIAQGSLSMGMGFYLPVSCALEESQHPNWCGRATTRGGMAGDHLRTLKSNPRKECPRGLGYLHSEVLPSHIPDFWLFSFISGEARRAKLLHCFSSSKSEKCQLHPKVDSINFLHHHLI